MLGIFWPIDLTWRPFYLIENSFSIWGWGLAKTLGQCHSGGMFGEVRAGGQEGPFSSQSS